MSESSTGGVYLFFMAFASNGKSDSFDKWQKGPSHEGSKLFHGDYFVNLDKITSFVCTQWRDRIHCKNVGRTNEHFTQKGKVLGIDLHSEV